MIVILPTVAEIKNILSEYPDDMQVVVEVTGKGGKTFQSFDISAVENDGRAFVSFYVET